MSTVGGKRVVISHKTRQVQKKGATKQADPGTPSQIEYRV